MERDSLDIGTIRTAAALRGQLAQMTAASQMLERNAKDEKSKGYLAAMNQSICRMLRIVGRMELTARLTEETQLELAPVDLGVLVYETGSQMAGLLRHVGVRLDVYGPEHLPAQADGTLIRQLLLELTSNAAGKGDQVALSLAKEGRQAVFTVTDNGAGLPPEGIARLFGEGGEELPDWRKPGTGVAIARRVANLHGGRLVASCGPGQGLRVAVSIPLNQAETDVLSSPGLRWDQGGFSEELIALSGLLPAAAFLPGGDWSN